ncbi:RloB family protein [Ruegeria arenilitoris]|uniref:RloB family protein n=1 Tax=Ruegeria arenilitoris TaxID=1173585 RepID=UPI001479D537|nr:RloB family protein [Ruegeria arenilitoris]
MIVCEGEKTEPGYLHKLISEYRVPTAKVRVHGEGGAAPISVVEYADEILDKDADFEHIFLVFDRDAHSTYQDAITKTYGFKKRRKLQSKNIEAVTSIPCFEVWLLLHVSTSCKPYGTGVPGTPPGKQVIRDLRAYPAFANYEKSKIDFFDEIKEETDNAIARAKRQVDQAQKAGSPVHHEDSSSRFFLIVDTLKKIASS